MLEKFKSFLGNDLLFHSVLLFLVSAASFGFGRLSVIDPASDKKPLISGENSPAAALITALPTEQASTSATSVVAKTESSATEKTIVVGSKSGTKYHLPDCPGAKRIKPANLITFESIEAAKAAGYSPASNCKGLQ